MSRNRLRGSPRRACARRTQRRCPATHRGGATGGGGLRGRRFGTQNGQQSHHKSGNSAPSRTVMCHGAHRLCGNIRPCEQMQLAYVTNPISLISSVYASSVAFLGAVKKAFRSTFSPVSSCSASCTPHLAVGCWNLKDLEKCEAIQPKRSWTLLSRGRGWTLI